jgi:hypothetical protein
MTSQNVIICRLFFYLTLALSNLQHLAAYGPTLYNSHIQQPCTYIPSHLRPFAVAHPEHVHRDDTVSNVNGGGGGATVVCFDGTDVCAVLNFNNGEENFLNGAHA